MLQRLLVVGVPAGGRHVNLDLTLDFQRRRAQEAVELDVLSPRADLSGGAPRWCSTAKGR